MLLTIIGLALLFIILVNVVLFCLETEAVGIIISIIGILVFLSGGYLYGVIVVIVGICLYNHAKETNEKAEKERSKNISNKKCTNLWNNVGIVKPMISIGSFGLTINSSGRASEPWKSPNQSAQYVP